MKRIRYAALALVLLITFTAAALYVVSGISGSRELATAKRTAVADIRAGLPAAVRTADRDRGRVVSAARAWGSPAYSWTELICTIDTVDAGWIVEDYEQGCRVRTVDLFTDSSRAHGCRPTRLPGGLPRLDRSSVVSLHRATTEALTDRGPDADWSCPDGIGTALSSGAARRLSGEPAPQLAPRASWRVITVEVPVSESALGCDPWHLLSCDSPVDVPVLGD